MEQYLKIKALLWAWYKIRKKGRKKIMPSNHSVHIKSQSRNYQFSSVFAPWFCSWSWFVFVRWECLDFFPLKTVVSSPFSPSSCSSLPLFTKCWILDSKLWQRGRSRRGWYFFCLDPSISQHCRGVISKIQKQKNNFL